MRILLINPNRSAWVTERLAAPARAMLLPGERLDTLTSQDGPEMVRTPEQVGAAESEVLALAARHGGGYDALVLGISLDCGLDAARRQRGPQPVIGMTEAACLAACTAGARFGLLTVGPAMAPLYAAHVRALGLEARCVGVEAPDAPEAFAAGAHNALPASAAALLAQGAQALRARGADSIVLAGAVLCGSGPALAIATGMPCFEGTACAIGLARMHWQHSAMTAAAGACG